MPNSNTHAEERHSSVLVSVLVDPQLALAPQADGWPIAFIESSKAQSASKLDERTLSKIDAAILIDSASAKSRQLSPAEALHWAQRSDHAAAKCVLDMLLARQGSLRLDDDSGFPRVYLVGSSPKPETIERILREVIVAYAVHLENWLDLTLRERTALREEAEDLHEAMADMQDVVARMWDTRSLQYEALPGKAVKGIGSVPLLQRLPCLARGICDIELHVPDSQERQSKAELKVELLEFETKAVLFEWTLPVADLTAGWNRFCVPTAVICKRFNACLRLSASEPGIALSMGEVTAVSKAALHPVESGGDLRPVAVKVWRALPGTTHVQSAADDGEWTKFLPSLFGALKLMLPQKAVAAYPLFEVRPTGFQLHPWHNMVSIVGAVTTLPARSANLRIRARVKDERSRDVDVAVGFFADRIEDILDPGELKFATCFSSWKMLRGGETADLNMVLPGTPMSGLLFFAARMHDPMGSADFSVTEWSALELMKASRNKNGS